jgi:hypothetical protein
LLEKYIFLGKFQTFLKIMPWYQRRKQVRNWGVGCYLGCRIKGYERVLRSNTGWVHSVSSSAILCCCFCSEEIFRHKEFLHGVRTVVKQASNNVALWIPLQTRLQDTLAGNA